MLALLLASVLTAPHFELRSPEGFAQGERRPLVVVLHGLGGDSVGLGKALHVDHWVKERRFHALYAEGEKDSQGRAFWNATRACCDLENRGPEDLQALLAKIRETAQQVRASKVFVVGFSNGAFMALRLACESPEQFDAVVSLAGASPPEKQACARTKRWPRILFVHGTADDVISTRGGHIFGLTEREPYPSLEASVAFWKQREGCASGETAMKRDLGVSARTTRSGTHCAGVEVWLIEGSGHSLPFGKLGGPIADYLQEAR